MKEENNNVGNTHKIRSNLVLLSIVTIYTCCFAQNNDAKILFIQCQYKK